MAQNTQGNQNGKVKGFYGWFIVVACFLLSASSTGLLTNLNSLFITPAIETLKVNHSTFMLFSTLAMFASMLATPFIGPLFRKHSARKLIIIGGILGACAHLIYSVAANVWFFYLGGIIAGASSGLFGTIPMNYLLANWFYDKRGTMTGIAFTGSSLITSALSPVVTRLIAAYGWRATYRILAVTIIIVVLISVLLIRTKPEDIGQRPLGTENKSEAEIKPTGFMRKDAMKKIWFWTYAIGVFLMGLVVSGTQQQLVTYWTSEGISAARAATFFSVVMLVGLVAKILLGGVFDHFGSSKSIIICGIICAAAFATLATCLGNVSAFIPVILFGIVSAELVIVPSFTVQRVFGLLDYASNVSLFTTILFLGSAVGIPFCAIIFDFTGSYRIAWFLYAVLAVILTICLFISNKLSIKAFKDTLGIERVD